MPDGSWSRVDYEEATDVGPRTLALPLVAVYVGILVAFALPFATLVDACTADVAGPVTGWELMTGAAVERSDVVAGGFEEEAGNMQLPAAVAFASAVVGAGLGLAFAVGRLGHAGRGMIATALLVAVGLVTVLLQNAVFNEPEVGLVLALALTLVAVLLAMMLARSEWPPGGDGRFRFGRASLLLAASGWLLFPILAGADSDTAFLVLGVLVGTAHVAALVAGLLGLFIGRPAWSALVGTVLCLWPAVFLTAYLAVAF